MFFNVPQLTVHDRKSLAQAYSAEALLHTCTVRANEQAAAAARQAKRKVGDERLVARVSK